eukprot:m.119773 g.119773  ORF g.119773 m.119773 type:complete len:134 (+) comp37710_c0_seq12:1481-1882(+)
MLTSSLFVAPQTVVYNADSVTSVTASSNSSAGPLFELVFPPNSLNVSNGSEIIVTVVGIDPTVSLGGVPDLIAVQQNGSEPETRVNLESLTLVEVTVTDSVTGDEVAIVEPVQLRLPLSPSLGASAGDRIEAW